MPNEFDLNHLDKRLFVNNDGPHEAEIFEIKGRRGHGKTQLLTYIVAKMIMPVDYGGKNCGVLLVNADNEFNLGLLNQVMTKLYKLSFGESQMKWLKKSLKNLMILNISTYSELNDIFAAVHKVLTNNPTIRGLAIDSINNFYYNFVTDPFYFHKNHYYLQAQMKELKRICTKYGLTLFYTKTTDFNPYMYLNYDAHIDYMWELLRFRGVIYARVTMASDPKSIQYKMIVINDFGLDWTRMNNCDDSMSSTLERFYRVLLAHKERLKETRKSNAN